MIDMYGADPDSFYCASSIDILEVELTIQFC